MTSSRRRRARCLAIGVAWLLIGAMPTRAAEFDRERFFERAWFVMEVIVFAYPRPADATPPFLALDREREAFMIPATGRSLKREETELMALQQRIDANAIALEAMPRDGLPPRPILQAGERIGSYVDYGNLHFPAWLWDETPFWAWHYPEREAQGIDLDQPGYRTALPPLPPMEPEAEVEEEAPPSDLDLMTEAALRFEASLTTQRLTPERVTQLRRAERNLSRRFEVLFAGRWIQEVPSRDQPEPVLIDRRLDGQDGSLIGYLSFTLGRYLHLDAFLVRQYEDGEASVLNEHRRMRSREVHYLDHPALGIVVRIDRLDVPQVLEDLAFRLNNPTQ